MASIELRGGDADDPMMRGNASNDRMTRLQGRHRSIQAAESFLPYVEKTPLDPDRVHTLGPVTYYDGQVLEYDSCKIGRFFNMSSFSRPPGFRRGPISGSVKDLILSWVVAVVVSVSLWALDDKINDRTRWLEPGKGLLSQTRSILTFLMGFFLSSALGRWWAMRNDCLGGLWGACDDLIMLTSAHFPSETERDVKIRKLILRWCTASFQLVFKQARQTDNDLEDMVCVGLLTEEEKSSLLRFPSKGQVVWAWLTSFCSHLAYGDEDNGGSCLPFPRETLPQLHQLCTQARGSIGQTFAYTDTQIPLRYFAMLAQVTWLTNIFQGIYSGYVINISVIEGWKATFWCEIVYLLSFNSLFTALLNVGESMLNPVRACFSEGFPGAAWGEFLRNECAAFQQANIAPPYGKPAVWSSSKACQKYWYGAK